MELEKTLSNLNFPNFYQEIIDKIDLERANDFVKIMINKLVVKFGSEEISSEIQRDNSDSTISNHLTHIIEVGGLKIISDNNLSVNLDNRENFENTIVSVVFVLNCSLAIELKRLNLYFGNTSNYYGNDAISIIVNRLSKHTFEGIKNPNGLKHYSNQMIQLNLLNKI